jgi:hypothetical protein
MKEQLQGKLIQRDPLDAETINHASSQFFAILNDICRDANLTQKFQLFKKRPY